MNPGIACLASQSSDWLDALWASLSGVQSSMIFVRLDVIGCSWGGMFNYLASTRWLIDCALAHTTYLGKIENRGNQDKLKAEESFAISESGYTLGRL